MPTQNQLTYLSLFSGACGGDLGLQHLLGWRCLGYVEIEPYCQQLIRQRIIDGFLTEAPIFSDIRDFINQGFAESYQGMVKAISAGFPCQPFSVAGKHKGEQDERNFWPETKTVIQTIKPSFILLENVPGILSYLPVVIRDLRRTGYTVKKPAIIGAASVGAGHIRNRVWIYANLNEKRWPDNQGSQTAQKKRKKRTTPQLADEEIFTNSNKEGQLQQKRIEQNERKWIEHGDWWKTEPNLVRVVYGIPYGMERIGALGEAQVPRVVEVAWEVLNDPSRCCQNRFS